MNFRIYRLGESDEAQCKALLEVFARAFGDPETYLSAIPEDSYTQQLLRKNHIIPLVACLEGKVVGGLIAYVLEKFEQERSEIYIYDLAVEESFRRRGIATQLIHKLKDYARNFNAWVIYVQADKDDGPAIKLYESLGTREDVHHFDIILK